MFTKKKYNKKRLEKTISKKKYTKKRLEKTISKKRCKKTKIQKGGFICKTPIEIIKVAPVSSSSFLSFLPFKKSNDKKVNSNSEPYTIYLDECYKYSSCVFDNIINTDLLINLLEILKDIGNEDIDFKYKKITDTSTVDYDNKEDVERTLPNDITIQTESIQKSKFLDVYLTSLIEYYLASEFTDDNTVFLREDDYKFIINEDYNLVKNAIISTIIGLEDKFVVKSILQILSNTLTNLSKDSDVLKEQAVYYGGMDTTIPPYKRAIFVSNMLFVSFIHIFLYNFSKYIVELSTSGKNKKSYAVLSLIYKIVYSYLKKLLDKFIAENDTPFFPFMNDDVLNNFIIGKKPENVESLPIFSHLLNTFAIFDCLVKNFLQPERLNTLCNELDGYLTKNMPLVHLKDYKFIIEGCVGDILLKGWSVNLLNGIYNYMYPGK
jgi:hypothetical protein